MSAHMSWTEPTEVGSWRESATKEEDKASRLDSREEPSAKHTTESTLLFWDLKKQKGRKRKGKRLLKPTKEYTTKKGANNDNL